MAESGAIELNRGAALRAGDQVRESRQLAAMREALQSLGNVRGLFGRVPGAEAAEQALVSAATAMQAELASTGLTVQDISDSAYRMAEIAEETDQAARDRLISAGEVVRSISHGTDGQPATSERG